MEWKGWQFEKNYVKNLWAVFYWLKSRKNSFKQSVEDNWFCQLSGQSYCTCISELLELLAVGISLTWQKTVFYLIWKSLLSLKVKRFKKGDTFAKSSTFIPTFDIPDLPTTIDIGYERVLVHLYIPNPFS